MESTARECILKYLDKLEKGKISRQEVSIKCRCSRSYIRTVLHNEKKELNYEIPIKSITEITSGKNKGKLEVIIPSKLNYM